MLYMILTIIVWKIIYEDQYPQNAIEIFYETNEKITSPDDPRCWNKMSKCAVELESTVYKKW